VRVALLNEGAYPYQSGGVSTWCQQLVTGLDRHTFHLVTLTGIVERRPVAYPLPANVATVNPVAVWDRPVAVSGRLARRRHRRAATTAAIQLCHGLLGEEQERATAFRTGLSALAELAAGGCHPLHDVPLADVLLDAWQAARAGSHQADIPSGIGDYATDVVLPLPRLSLRDAHRAAELLEHAVRPLAVRLPTVDLSHAVSAGLALLTALAAKWREGTPYLLTEHGVYLRERYLEYGEGLPLAVKTVLLRFYRALARLGYAQAGLVSSVSRFNQRWELRHGANPAEVLVVPNGVDPEKYPPLREEPETPTVVWVGRIDPLKDLHTLIRAFRLVRDAVPAARLRLVGPVPHTDDGYADSCHALVGQLGLDQSVEFPGPVSSSRDAYATGHVVALSSISEGMPYTVIEAMMCGRPTVSTDVGGVAETVGDAGLVVAPGDPAAFAAACVDLLRDPEQRRRLGEAARDRALNHFTTDRMIRAYDHLYGDIQARRGTGTPDTSAPTHTPRQRRTPVELGTVPA
jgi:glycosyltransferase involved in cell wall biosynthesis